MANKFSKILVPVRGIAPDDRAVGLASLIARRNKAAVLAICVIEVQRALPLDAENAAQTEHAEQVLKRAEQVAKENGIKIETEVLQARAAGAALLNEAAERGVDLIIMGIPYREPLVGVPLGSTASYILNNARCEVWLCREAETAKAVEKGG
jgi:nucleotide-binding universal stress UspA family protein